MVNHSAVFSREPYNSIKKMFNISGVNIEFSE